MWIFQLVVCTYLVKQRFLDPFQPYSNHILVLNSVYWLQKKILYTRTLCNCNMYFNIPVCISSQRYIIKVCLHPDVYLNFTRYMYHFLIQIVILEIYKY